MPLKKYGLTLIYSDENSGSIGREPDHAAVWMGMLVGGLERSDIARANAGKADLRAEPADSGADGSYTGGASWAVWSEAT